MIWSIPMDIAPNHAGTAGGLMNTGFGIAGIVSPIVFGRLIDVTGSFVAPFTLSAALLVVGGLAALWIDPPERLPDDSPLSPSPRRLAENVGNEVADRSGGRVTRADPDRPKGTP